MIKKGVIYVITNIVTGEKYVGATTVSAHDRFRKHCLAKNKTKIGRAISEYGVSNFKYDVIESDLEIHSLSDRESYWINKLDTINSGYNINNGGGSREVSNSTRLKLSRVNSGKILSSDHKRKIGMANKGKTHTEKSKRHFSESHKGNKISEETKAKLSRALKGRHHTAEHSNRISEGLKKYHMRKQITEREA